MKGESAGVYNVNFIFRIVLGYYTLRRSEMVGSVSVTTPDTSYMGAEPRYMRKLRLAGIIRIEQAFHVSLDEQ